MEITETPNYRAPAVLRGEEYCSPQCGFGCTRAAYQRATEEADALASRLGAGWRPNVWENCGWQYEVTRGVCRVSISTRGGSRLDGTWILDGYIGWINTDPQFISKVQPTPEEAFREAVLLMKAVFDELKASFSDALEISSAMGLIPQSS